MISTSRTGHDGYGLKLPNLVKCILHLDNMNVKSYLKDTSAFFRGNFEYYLYIPY